GLRPLSDADLAVKIGFAGVVASTDPWLAAYMTKLFELYNRNHTEAVNWQRSASSTSTSRRSCPSRRTGTARTRTSSPP
ncbi:MAG TPA: hypothetical protein VHF47_09680, partial [Acidimicrobiales bacterium]|nr:hypothetical protein [Acidimicrobiales bacterium]